MDAIETGMAALGISKDPQTDFNGEHPAGIVP